MYHNGGPGHKSIFLSYDELRAVSFEINAVTRYEPWEPVRTRVHTHLAHKIQPHSTRHYPVLCGPVYNMLLIPHRQCNTTSYIAIPYDNFSS